MIVTVNISADCMLHDENIIAQMDQITKDIACKSPLVSEPEPVENLKPEYLQNEGFLAKIEVLTYFFVYLMFDLIFPILKYNCMKHYVINEFMQPFYLTFKHIYSMC